MCAPEIPKAFAKHPDTVTPKENVCAETPFTELSGGRLSAGSERVGDVIEKQDKAKISLDSEIVESSPSVSPKRVKLAPTPAIKHARVVTTPGTPQMDDDDDDDDDVAPQHSRRAGGAQPRKP